MDVGGSEQWVMTRGLRALFCTWAVAVKTVLGSHVGVGEFTTHFGRVVGLNRMFTVATSQLKDPRIRHRTCLKHIITIGVLLIGEPG